MPHHISQLENVLLPGFHLILFSELFSKFSTSFDVFRANIIDGDLNTIRGVGHLTR